MSTKINTSLFFALAFLAGCSGQNTNLISDYSSNDRAHKRNSVAIETNANSSAYSSVKKSIENYSNGAEKPRHADLGQSHVEARSHANYNDHYTQKSFLKANECEPSSSAGSTSLFPRDASKSSCFLNSDNSKDKQQPTNVHRLASQLLPVRTPGLDQEDIGPEQANHHSARNVQHVDPLRACLTSPEASQKEENQQTLVVKTKTEQQSLSHELQGLHIIKEHLVAQQKALEQQRLADAKRQQQLEAQRSADAKRQAADEQLRLAAERQAEQAKLAAERKAEQERLIAERKAQQQAAQRLAAQQQALEQQRLADAKRQQQLEAQRSADAKRQAADEQRRLAAERKAEETRLAAERKAEQERLAAAKRADDEIKKIQAQKLVATKLQDQLEKLQQIAFQQQQALLAKIEDIRSKLNPSLQQQLLPKALTSATKARTQRNPSNNRDITASNFSIKPDTKVALNSSLNFKNADIQPEALITPQKNNTPESNQSNTTTISEAQLSYLKGNFGLSVKQYTIAIATNPTDSLLFSSRAKSRLSGGDIKGAGDDLDRAIQLNPSDAGNYLARAQVKDLMGDKQAALFDLSHAIKLNPGLEVALYKRAALQAELGDKQNALKDYNATIAINPRNTEALYSRAILNEDSGYRTDAIDDFTRIIAILPNHAAAYFRRGRLKDEMGDAKGAVLDYDASLASNSSQANVYNNRGLIKSNQGDTQSAIRDFDQAIQLNPNYYAAYNNLGAARHKQKDFPGAIAAYTKAIELNPNYASAYANRGITLEAAGNLPSACRDWKKAATLGDSDSLSWANQQCAR